MINVFFLKNYKVVLNIPRVCPFSQAFTQLNFQIGVALVTHIMLAAPSPAVIPVATLTTGPNAVIPQPAPITAPVLPENPTIIHPQRLIAGVKCNKKMQLMKGGYKRC